MHFSFYVVDPDYCDFLKINNGEWGAINLNNMIPVPVNSLRNVDIKISEADSSQDIAYKNLMSNQLSWCSSHKTFILKQADKLYRIIVDGKGWEILVKLCCNFSLDEKQYVIYSADRSMPAASVCSTFPHPQCPVQSSS